MSALDDLFERFPEMKPVDKAPTLQTVNGIGTTAYGRRDLDPETGTYVLTQWFTILYIPLIPIASYRVANAPGGGWYFLGRVPISGIAKAWPACLVLVIAAVVGGISWHNYTNSPAYHAQQRLNEADRLRDQGQFAAAARVYREVAEGPTEHAAAAVKSAVGLLDRPDLEKAPPAEVARAFQTAYDLRDRPGALKEKELFERGLKLADARADDSPAASLAILDAVEPAAPSLEAVLPSRQKVLERLTADHPGDVEHLSRLAVVYELTGQRDRCRPLLEPHANKLGVTEGARVLGMIYAEQDKHEEAYGLLQPYADAHLKGLVEAEKRFEDAIKAKQAETERDLNGGHAKDFPYDRYEHAAEPQKQQILGEYFTRRIKDDPEIKRLREALARAGVVVPVALDLGIVQLRRGQQMKDPAARKAELERAEKTFLSVRTQAGGSNEYRLSLGQVYYWLGKQGDGRKLFDEVLQADGRKHDTLMLVARLLRELGAMADSRVLSEEAYNQNGAEPKNRQDAAMLRAITSTDIDDELVWLERVNSAEPRAKAELATVRGHKAVRDGKDEEAANHFREAVKIYAGLPENEATLNNSALASMALYHVTGEREALDRGVQMLEKAVKLRPGDGILVGNVASVVLGAALRDVIGDRIDLKKLRREGSLNLCAFLYTDSAGHQAIARRVKESPGVVKARGHYDRALVLAPNNPHNYQGYQVLLSFLDDRDALGNLVRRAEEARPDVTDDRKVALDFVQGKSDEKYRTEYAAAVTRAERTLKQVREAGGVTFAVAAVGVVHAKLALEPLGIALDLDEVVRLAEEAHKAAPSSATAAALEGALLARASKALAAQEPEYAAMTRRAQRSLGSTYLVAVALWREGNPRAAALANADVKRALESVRTRAAAFPDTPSEWQWAMLRPAYPEDAAKIAEALKGNEMSRQERALEARLSPASATTAFRLCWALHSVGKSQEGLAELRKCGAEGVPLPFDVK
jgi:hypothetical protein